MVNGQITDAGAAIKAALQKHKDWFDASTLKVLFFVIIIFVLLFPFCFISIFLVSFLIIVYHQEPYRIEGKKTMGYEIAEQFQWELPNVILYPTGGGVGLIGIYKVVLPSLLF